MESLFSPIMTDVQLTKQKKAADIHYCEIFHFSSAYYLLITNQQSHVAVAYTFLAITLQQSSGFPSSVALMPHNLGIGLVMAASGVCSLLWVSV